MSRPARRVVLAAVPVAAALLVLLAAVWRPAAAAAPAGGPADQAVLPSQGENVVAVAVEFGDRAGDGLDADNLAVLAEVDAFLRAMEGLRGYSSPLRATVVRATEFDIVVRPFVPAALLERHDERVAAELRGPTSGSRRFTRTGAPTSKPPPSTWSWARGWRRRCWWSGSTRCSAGWRSSTGLRCTIPGCGRWWS